MGCGGAGCEECGVRGVREAEVVCGVIGGQGRSGLWCGGRGRGGGDLEEG